jgi:PAS domain S-box-containing protein
MHNQFLEAPFTEDTASHAAEVAAANGLDVRIRVLILEDRPEDAELMEYELRRSWFAPVCQRVETEADFLAELVTLPDVILSDYRMPQLDAPRALELLRDMAFDIPFIVVSGAIGEDAAVAMMRKGATDYLLKDRLRRLGPAVRRALAEKQVREEKRRAENALKASEARFYSFMNHSPALGFIKDHQGHILYMNNTCEQVWSRSASQCEGKLDHELWPAEEAARLHAEDVAVLDRGEPSRVLEELEVPDAGVRHLLTYRFPFEDAAGCRMLGGVSVDITEQVRSEQALAAALAVKETLLREVHHRVKNNLQIISSLLDMQAELLPDAAQRLVFQESQQRVQAMAMIHERLCGHDDLDRVDFREYVDAVTRGLFAAHGVDSGRVRLRLELAPVSLELNQAIPCGLILNELVTNALKYAFPDERVGEILVVLSSDKEDRITLRVADDGVGMPPGPDSKLSLGLGIVRVLTKQLGGVVETTPGDGVNFSLKFQRTGCELYPTLTRTKTSRAGN